ncbi:hypothetical protein ADICYQ_1460 [Cyclobacterium qasimii M12-11B]|uniref:Uncharacterized protein n=1 Tax=Cyclobacterium qasimii M12-11B TaxID=641524 RepID=S7VHJ8_9BACT|nr:hypothetical protein ADICYQ_1460 [Cyclobacterium qasimii M12-11B]
MLFLVKKSQIFLRIMGLCCARYPYSTEGISMLFDKLHSLILNADFVLGILVSNSVAKNGGVF